jgi:hypothetical protein
MPDYVNVRIWEDTRRLLRLIAAETGEQMVQVMHRLCEEEWRKSTPEKTPDEKAKRGVKSDEPRSGAE